MSDQKPELIADYGWSAKRVFVVIMMAFTSVLVVGLLWYGTTTGVFDTDHTNGRPDTANAQEPTAEQGGYHHAGDASTTTYEIQAWGKTFRCFLFHPAAPGTGMYCEEKPQ